MTVQIPCAGSKCKSPLNPYAAEYNPPLNPFAAEYIPLPSKPASLMPKEDSPSDFRVRARQDSRCGVEELEKDPKPHPPLKDSYEVGSNRHQSQRGNRIWPRDIISALPASSKRSEGGRHAGPGESRDTRMEHPDSPPSASGSGTEQPETPDNDEEQQQPRVGDWANLAEDSQKSSLEAANAHQPTWQQVDSVWTLSQLQSEANAGESPPSDAARAEHRRKAKDPSKVAMAYSKRPLLSAPKGDVGLSWRAARPSKHTLCLNPLEEESGWGLQTAGQDQKVQAQTSPAMADTSPSKVSLHSNRGSSSTPFGGVQPGTPYAAFLPVSLKQEQGIGTFDNPMQPPPPRKDPNGPPPAARRRLSMDQPPKHVPQRSSKTTRPSPWLTDQEQATLSISESSLSTEMHKQPTKTKLAVPPKPAQPGDSAGGSANFWLLSPQQQISRIAGAYQSAFPSRPAGAKQAATSQKSVEPATAILRTEVTSQKPWDPATAPLRPEIMSPGWRADTIGRAVPMRSAGPQETAWGSLPSREDVDPEPNASSWLPNDAQNAIKGSKPAQNAYRDKRQRYSPQQRQIHGAEGKDMFRSYSTKLWKRQQVHPGPFSCPRPHLPGNKKGWAEVKSSS